MKNISIFLVISFLMSACNLLSLMQSTKDIKSSQVPQSAETSQPIQNPNENQCSEPQAISGTWCSDEQWANIKKCGKFKGKLTFTADGNLVNESGAIDGGECSSIEKTKWILDCNTISFKIRDWSDWEGTLEGKTISGTMSNPDGSKGTWKAVYSESGDCGIIPTPITNSDSAE